MFRSKHITAIIPARDEALSIGRVVTKLKNLSNNENLKIFDRIIVCDNGSTDSTADIAYHAGAKVVFETRPGYGLACLTALKAVKKTDILLFIDGDNAFRVEQAIPLINSIANGADLAIGSRKLGYIEKNALTPPQRFGNWLASHLILIIWGEKVSDLGPFRAISRHALERMNMEDKQYGWTIEMQIKAIQLAMTTTEHPVDTYCRLGHSKISGTFKGTIGAGIGILSMIIKLRWQQFKKTTSIVNYSTTKPRPTQL